MEKNDAIQWYPGHMAKASRQIREKLKLIDIVVEVLDARLPVASKNPDIDQYTEHKRHLVLLNKADLADPDQNQKWADYLKGRDSVDEVMLYNAFDQKKRPELVAKLRSLNPKDKKQLKCLICGIPNVGKSTIINSLIGKKKTQIGNKPGVTKGQQWLTAPDGLMLLDTPGILWPKFEDPEVGVHLAWIGSIKDTIFEKENIAADLLKFLVGHYPQDVAALYKIDLADKRLPEIFDAVAKSRGLLLRGGEYDYFRTSEMLLNDFKNGKVGRITIDQR
ncbi:MULTISPECIES: ribosome biogenesis GTPase YlqF [Eubacterium]|uniref:Ribosome biogenesis GTPase A n=1 Tax=Eubacterium maltosivorans TaxID=2041044 RepID=A0A4P9CCU7_EUBML|nr:MULTISPECIES: ribosome biogenesis GTPase YlqF [Eubacterium]MDO5434071.1 ribosome biogenesis GTPase YlqF [Eubacterium sp.]QCT73539.1 ribosome biogenesis GTPase YlqF [Eubacterium maltosivorans]